MKISKTTCLWSLGIVLAVCLCCGTAFAQSQSPNSSNKQNSSSNNNTFRPKTTIVQPGTDTHNAESRNTNAAQNRTSNHNSSWPGQVSSGFQQSHNAAAYGGR